MANKIFVRNLSWGTDDNSLSDFFSQCGGVVEAKVITERETGRSRGYGFVTFDDGDSAQRAVDLNGTELDGRPVYVDMARSKKRSRYND